MSDEISTDQKDNSNTRKVKPNKAGKVPDYVPLLILLLGHIALFAFIYLTLGSTDRRFLTDRQ